MELASRNCIAWVTTVRDQLNSLFWSQEKMLHNAADSRHAVCGGILASHYSRDDGVVLRLMTRSVLWLVALVMSWCGSWSVSRRRSNVDDVRQSNKRTIMGRFVHRLYEGQESQCHGPRVLFYLWLILAVNRWLEVQSKLTSPAQTALALTRGVYDENQVI